MFSFKAMSHKSSPELPEVSDCKSSASIALRAVSNKKMAVRTLEIIVGLVKMQRKLVVISGCFDISATHNRMTRSF